MKNYICIDGQKTELSNEQSAKVKSLLLIDDTKLFDVEIGETFSVGGYEFIVLDRNGDETMVILKDLLVKNEMFGDSNNFDGSRIDDICKDFAEELSAAIGHENLVVHTVDLTSDDGLRDYGKIVRQVSLLTADIYRRYVDILDLHKIDAWWWLATSHSTTKHGNACWVKCVSPSGFIGDRLHCRNGSGVRPFCILKSNIFVSKRKEQQHEQ